MDIKNIRSWDEYKNLDSYTATGLAEGFVEGDQKEIACAWQYLLDTGLCWHLQGFFGRTAMALWEDGKLLPPLKDQKDAYGRTIKGKTTAQDAI